jgi:histidinol-phosphate/aromatic aminotransferase/cobyric acid decarboxylase-like protein
MKNQLLSPLPRPARKRSAPMPCFHGGAFFEAVGEDFDTLGRKSDIINADVLDAWFPPAPGVLEALHEHLPWLARTSPPAQAAGLVRAISRARRVPADSLLAGGGSSDLIFLALREWFTPQARAVVLDPTYGEYLHVLQHVVGCKVDRLTLAEADDYAVNLDELAAKLATAPDLLVLVNPNSPTGQHIPRHKLESVLQRAPLRTLVWVDETYIDYAGPGESLERFATMSPNVVVCKSMSKVYALSGLRCAYLCGSPELLAPLHGLTPPWAVGLPAQVAAVRALAEPEYYAGRYEQTHRLREDLAQGLERELGWTVTRGIANFVLARLPEDGPGGDELLAHCRERGLFLRSLRTFTERASDRLIRVAVKDAPTQERMIEILRGI